MAARLKRIYTAFSRYRKSKGFGIHSPFAFHFVLYVLREKAHFYAYLPLAELRRSKADMLRKTSDRRKIPSEKTLRIIFKVTNRFNPRHIMIIGGGTGLEATAALLVNSSSTATLFDNDAPDSPAITTLKDFGNRIKISGLPVNKMDETTDDCSYSIVSNIKSEDIETVCNVLSSVDKGVIIIPDMDHNMAALDLWKRLTANSVFGMSFTNGKLGIFVVSEKLPNQHFRLWF